jgi:hypothetical protein
VVDATQCAGPDYGTRVTCQSTCAPITLVWKDARLLDSTTGVYDCTSPSPAQSDWSDHGDGAAHDVTVVFQCPEPLPPAPAPPPPVTKTVTDTFTRPGQSEPHAITIPTGTRYVTATVRWKSPTARFDVTGVRLVGGSAFPQAAAIKVAKKRGRNWVSVRVTRLSRGTLRFRVVARRVHGRTRAVTKIRRV